jgi:zinc protease
MPKSKTIHLLAAALAITLLPAASASAQATKASPKTTTRTIAPRIQFEKYKLKNGLDVILVEDHRLPLVAVNLWYHVGPANEKPGRTGFAHLFEHMMFQGSKHIPEKSHFKFLESAGASDINGTTNFDRTNYFETLPSNQLELALWLESDRMGFLLDKLDEKNLSNQRDVVRNERREGENRPYELVEEAMIQQLYPQGHPYYGNVIGSHADIESAELDDVRAFFQQYYTPNNASLAIVGDIDKAHAKALVEKYFGPIPAGPPVPKLDVKTPPITAERRKVVTDKVELPRVYMAWLTDPIYKPGDAEADLLAEILGGGKSSRLYKKLVYEKQIAQDVSASQYSLQLGSYFYIEATAKPGVKPEELEKTIDEELAAIRRDGPTPVEVERARNIIQTNIIRRLETLGGFGGVADRLNRYNHYLGDPGYLPQDLARYDQATPASIQKLATRELATDHSVVIYGVPGEKVIEDAPRRVRSAQKREEPMETAGAPDAWRNTPPPPGPASRLLLPVPKRMQLENGLTLYLVEQHTVPFVAANLVVLAGSEANPADEPGLASFTADMLDEGTKKRSTLQLADDVAQIGAQLMTSSNADASTVSIRTLKKNADAAFELLADVALDPAFDAKELERVRKQRLTQLLQLRDNPSALASRVFYRVVYGGKHPYSYPELGTDNATKAMTRDDLARFWKTGYAPANAALVVAGDMTEPELHALAEKYFGKWSGPKPSFHVPAADSKLTRHFVIVDKPGSPQTQLRIGQIGVSRDNPDYVPLEVMNTALGGLFSSRINMNLREKHGYTYGAFSVFLYRRGAGPFFAGGGFRTDATGDSVKEIFSEVERIREEPLSAGELHMAKDYISRSLPGLFETSPSAAFSVGQLFLYDLPLDYYRTLPAKVDAVTAADAERVAAKYLQPENMVVVAVGDRVKIEPQLEKLEIGASEVRDFEGNPVSAAKGSSH